MRDTSSFMVVNFPLDKQLDGLDGLSDLGAGNTIVFTHIPAGVAVYFAIDNNSQSKIQALQGMQIKTNHGGIYFTTVGTSADPMILAHWSSDDMEIITPPISTFETLNGFGLTALNQLSKAMNPYDTGVISGGSASPIALTTILNKTLVCDSVEVYMGGYADTTFIYNGRIVAKIDGVTISTCGSFNDSAGNSPHVTDRFLIDGCRGKVLTIESIVSNSAQHVFYALTEKQLKA